jgi:hypothetical protein
MGARGKLPKSKLPIDQTSVSPTLAYKQTKEDEARQRRYRAEEAMRDIERAEGHKKNKELMSDVKALAKEKIDSLSKHVLKKSK